MLYAVKPPMPRPKSLSSDDIASAALRIVDRDGLAALSMRSVAEELGVGTMSLYRYVADREQLESQVVDRVLRDVDLSVSTRLGWRARVSTLVERVRGVVVEHPEVIPLLLVHRASSEHSTRWGEAVLRELSEAGFTGTRRVIAFRTLLAYLIGALQLGHLSALEGEGTRALAALPTSDYPVLSETARHAQRVDAESEFRHGLAIVLQGLRD